MFHDFMFGGMWFGWIFWIVILVLIIWVIMKTVSKSTSDSTLNSSPHQESALDILKKRLASGEISEDEYNRLKKNIQ